ncbi:DinB family protein [Dactylosporangium sp. NPDC051541]|uniref:DinB family protein n=1 Tax=Dactylosporangium sp. NPDC051541 TaxID=3363977 RepID=UPI0037A415D5
MTTTKSHLRHYLQVARDNLLWKLDGLPEYDIRRPMVPTGTNLLGLVKHCASIEAGYFGETFGRKFPEPLPWFDDPDAEVNLDMYTTPDESRADIIGLYKRVWAHADETFDALDLESTGRVPWWSPDDPGVTLAQIMIHVIADVERHCGQADILRETIDGAVGWRPGKDSLAFATDEEFKAFHDKIEQAARAASQ